MSDKCKFCGADEVEVTLGPGYYAWPSYECGRQQGDLHRTPDCYEREIYALEAEVKQLRDEDDTPPIDERLAAAGKIFRELVAEREELRREVKRLKGEWPENWKEGIWEVKKRGDLGGQGATWLGESLEALTEAKQ